MLTHLSDQILRIFKYILIYGCIFLPFVMLAQTISQKRGLAYNISKTTDLSSLTQGVSWFYNWDIQPKSSIVNNYQTYNLDFVPMSWNGSFNQNTLKTFLQSHPKVKYLLGFNEPNFKSQANMKPSEAASQWKDLEIIADQYNLKLVSPAVNYCSTTDAVTENGITYTDPVQYLDDFFKACPNCRVDYIAVHCYMNYASALQSYIAKFKKYNKPIWLTEFCGWESGITPTIQRTLMVKAVDYLENDSAVFRYSWFNSSNTGSPYMQILQGDTFGSLTEMGNIYVNMSSCDSSYYFNTGATIPACQYRRMSGVLLEQTTDISGSIDVCDFTSGESLDYNVVIPSAGSYLFSFRVAAATAASLTLLMDGKSIGSQAIAPTGSFQTWLTQTNCFNLSSGNHTIRLQLSSGAICLNWWSITAISSGFIHEILDTVRLSPNPVSQLLNIHLPDPQCEVALLNVFGKTLWQKHGATEILMNPYSDGCYIVQITLPNGVRKMYKIIKKN